MVNRGNMVTSFPKQLHFIRMVRSTIKLRKFFGSLGFKIQSNFDLETTKINLHSVRALKRYLNEKNLIHGRETATIWKFSAQSF